MRHYPSFDNQKYDHTLDNDMVWAENKIDGQNFVARYNARTKSFIAFGSKKMIVDETHEQFGNAVKLFKENYEEVLTTIILENSKKKGAFTGVEELHFYFEYAGENSFCGFHEEGDEMSLTLIDVFLKKKGYLEPKIFYKIFDGYDTVKLPELIYVGSLTSEFITSINENDWTKPDCKYPTVKEGVVCKRSTLLKGQRLPMVKIKTNWWLDKLHANFPEDKWKELE